MRKVLFITNFKPGRGGISGQVEKLQQHLESEKYQTDVFSTKVSFFKKFILYKKLLRAGTSYDVFHIHACSNLGFIPAIVGIRAGKKLSKRVILTYHGGGAERFFARWPRLVRHYLLQTDTNIVLSGFLGDIFDKYQIPHVIIPNIVEFDGSVYRERNTVESRFISIRTLSPLYNIECILKAFKTVKKVVPQASLTIVGGGPSRQDLEAIVKNEHIEGVDFTGRVANADIYKYLDKADIMLSSPKIDNMPVSLLEAFNAGLLVISSNVGGVPYMVKNEENGLLFESDNASELSDKMLWALEHQEESLSMIRKAKASVDFYSWSNVREKLLKLYS